MTCLGTLVSCHGNFISKPPQDVSDFILVEHLYTAVLEEPSHTCSSYQNILHNYKLKQ